jgi:hypothetical protein
LCDHFGRSLVGATVIAPKNTKSLLESRKNPDIVLPDFIVDDDGGKIELGGTTLELLYLGKNQGDNSLIMRLAHGKDHLRGRFLAAVRHSVPRHGGYLPA